MIALSTFSLSVNLSMMTKSKTRKKLMMGRKFVQGETSLISLRVFKERLYLREALGIERPVDSTNTKRSYKSLIDDFPSSKLTVEAMLTPSTTILSHPFLDELWKSPYCHILRCPSWSPMMGLQIHLTIWEDIRHIWWSKVPVALFTTLLSRQLPSANWKNYCSSFPNK